MFVCIFLLFGLSMFPCVPPGLTQYIFHTPMTRYDLFVLKVSLNTNKPTKVKDSRADEMKPTNLGYPTYIVWR